MSTRLPSDTAITDSERRERQGMSEGSTALLRALHREHGPIIAFLLKNKSARGLDQ